ncbi:MAG: hypothetical protein MJ211_14545 [Bacteroidales bacterium]|nr:hypothetical protein [Bacteroidales bacterium]
MDENYSYLFSIDKSEVSLVNTNELLELEDEFNQLLSSKLDNLIVEPSDETMDKIFDYLKID